MFPAPCLPVAVRLLHPAGRGRAFAGRLGGQLLAGRFPPGRLPSGLLSSGHFLSPARGTAFRARAARLPSPRPRQMAAAASSPSPNDSGCAERRPPPGGGARGGATSRSAGGREHRGGACESPPGRKRPGRGRRGRNLPARADSPTPPAAANDRGPDSRRATPILTQSRSLRPVLGPPRRCERANGSRDRRQEQKIYLQRTTKPLCAPSPPTPPFLYRRFTLRHCVIEPLFAYTNDFFDWREHSPTR